jgi:glutamate synthase (ferredoxin)
LFAPPPLPLPQSLIKAGKVPDISVKDAQKNLKKSLEKGILKILSKMGISLLSCYHGAQIFEAYGLGRDVVDMCFRGSVSRIGGMSLSDLQREAESFWAKAFPDKAMTKLEDYGFIQVRRSAHTLAASCGLLWCLLAMYNRTCSCPITTADTR